MNPYLPPSNEDRENFNWKPVAITILAVMAMVNVLLIYLFAVGSVVRWLS